MKPKTFWKVYLNNPKLFKVLFEVMLSFFHIWKRDASSKLTLDCFTFEDKKRIHMQIQINKKGLIIFLTKIIAKNYHNYQPLYLCTAKVQFECIKIKCLKSKITCSQLYKCISFAS